MGNILEQKDYLGNTYNFKTTKKSYKSEKTICNPEEKQAVFENTHVALIDQEIWDLVQKARQSRRHPTKMAEQMETLSVSKRQLEKQMRRIAEIDGIIKRLYEDNLSGKLSDSRFAKMNADYEQEQQILEASSADLRRAVDFCEEQTVNIKSFLKCVRKYIEPSELTPDMLHELVDKIVVHAPDKSGGHRTQQVDIYYNFVGKIPLSEEAATRQTARYAVAHHAVCPEHENFFINTLPTFASVLIFCPAFSNIISYLPKNGICARMSTPPRRYGGAAGGDRARFLSHSIFFPSSTSSRSAIRSTSSQVRSEPVVARLPPLQAQRDRRSSAVSIIAVSFFIGVFLTFTLFSQHLLLCPKILLISSMIFSGARLANSWEMVYYFHYIM